MKNSFPILGTAGACALASLTSTPSALAEGQSTLLQSVPAGIVFPAFQEATIRNPAMLRGETAIAAEASFAPEWNGGTGSAGASAAWGNGKFGLGATLEGSSSANYDYSPSSGLISNQQWGMTNLVAGAALGTGNLSAGVSFSVPLNQNWSSRADLGIRLGKGSGLTTAFVLHDIDSLEYSATLEAGVGWSEPEMYSVEAHLKTPTFSTLATGYYEIGGDIVLHIKKLGLGFGALTYTGTTGGANSFGSQIRATYWLTKSWEVRASFDSNFAPTFGLTWAAAME